MPFPSKAYRLVFTLLTLFGSLIGCNSAPNVLTERPVQVAAPSDGIYEATSEVLRLHGYVLDRIDRRAGVVETYPLLSKQWFEFWRQDTVTFEDSLEAGLQTIRRRVIVTISPAEQDRQQVDCKVHVERLASEPPRAVKRVRGQEIFAETAGRIPSLAIPEGQGGPQWEDLGRDKTLEMTILEKIAQRSI